MKNPGQVSLGQVGQVGTPVGGGGRWYARSARGSPPGRVLPAIALNLHGPPAGKLSCVFRHVVILWLRTLLVSELLVLFL